MIVENLTVVPPPGKRRLFRIDCRVVRKKSEPTAARPALSPQKDTPAQRRTTDMPSKFKTPTAPSCEQEKEPVRKTQQSAGQTLIHSSRVSPVHAFFLGGFSPRPRLPYVRVNRTVCIH